MRACTPRNACLHPGKHMKHTRASKAHSGRQKASLVSTTTATQKTQTDNTGLTKRHCKTTQSTQTHKPHSAKPRKRILAVRGRALNETPGSKTVYSEHHKRTPGAKTITSEVARFWSSLVARKKNAHRNASLVVAKRTSERVVFR